MLTNIKLKGLTCFACQKIVENRLKKINGVKEVLVELKTGDVKINAQRLIDMAEITKVLEGTGFTIIK